MAPTRKARLTPLQRAFVQAFVGSNDPYIRHNATAAYLAACQGRVSPATARANGARMLANASVIATIQTLQVQAEAECFARLVDWKTAAIEAQPCLLNLIRGILPDGRPMVDRDTAAVGMVVLSALKEVMDLGYPKKLYLHTDPREALAKLLGVQRDQLPDTMDDEEAC